MRRLLLAIGVLFVFSFPANAQISPGELSRAHQSLEGVTKCTSCHEKGEEITGQKCLDCHVEIGEARNSKHGLHAINASKPCISCHLEHLGKDENITGLDQSKFDHRQTGFILQGKHGSLKCEQCHTPEHIVAPQAKAWQKKHSSRTFVGMNTSCVSCHQDRHNGTLGSSCESCHAASGWSPTVSFVHAKTKFVLEGKHATVLCQKCHEGLRVKDKTKPLTFRVASYTECRSCHQSPHPDKIAKKGCETCHTTAGWNVVTKFDHDKTSFKLIGKHIGVTCEKCHAEVKRSKPEQQISFSAKPFRDCSPCHSTPHSAGFSKEACSSCHSPNSWKVQNGKQFDHAMTAFPLNGKHASAKCQDCHKQQAGNRLKLKVDCVSCHKDEHRGEFAVTEKNNCAHCHNDASFKPSTFSHQRHNDSKFPLKGAHIAVPCRACHVQSGQLTFRFTSVRCEQCHADKHSGQFASAMKSRSCDACHAAESWKIDAFDHSVTGFSLVGKHNTAPCSGCHKPGTFSEAIIYKGTSKICADCHVDTHQGQFAVDGSVDCAKCHTPVAWNSLLYKHESMSRFPLTGAHRSVDCRGCHKREEQNGKPFVRYRPLSVQCESCHQGAKQ